MATSESLQVAAQCWCDPRTSDCTMDPLVAEVFAEKLDAQAAEQADLLEAAWGLIANAYGGDWELAQNRDWKPAAERWRDAYHKTLPQLHQESESPP